MGQHPSKDQREINTMAFRARDPNTLVPSRSDDPNWRTTSAPNKSNNAVALFDSKAPNAVVGPSPIGGTILQQQGNNQAIVPIQPSQYQATLGQHTSSDDSPNSMPWYRADGLSPIPRRAPFSRMSSFPPPPQQQQPNAFQSRLMSVWDDSVTGHAQANISGNGTLQANQAASSRPPMTNRTNAESASGGLRSGGGGSGYSMAGRQYTASSSISQPRGYGVPPGFASYSAAARSHIPPPPQRKLTVPAFEIYKDYKAEQNQENKLATGPKTLEQYSREIHALSESCDRGSAQQAEFVLRSIIFKFKNGEHDIQPDGACYNRFVDCPSLARSLVFIVIELV
jgi:hypothetical protein